MQKQDDKAASGPMRMKLCYSCAERMGLMYWVNEIRPGEGLEVCHYCNRYYRLSSYELTPKNKYILRRGRSGGGERDRAGRRAR